MEKAHRELCTLALSQLRFLYDAKIDTRIERAAREGGLY
jgi:hypothetical protein